MLMLEENACEKAVLEKLYKETNCVFNHPVIHNIKINPFCSLQKALQDLLLENVNFSYFFPFSVDPIHLMWVIFFDI